MKTPLLLAGALALTLTACEPAADAPADADTMTEVAVAEVPAGTYALDGSHSDMGFKVRHLGISNVDGTFRTAAGTITVPEEGLSGLSADVTIDATSIDTGNDDRDGHLRSPDFFDAANHPEITFQTTGIETLGGERFRMTGDLTMRGVTKPVTLEGTFLGAAAMGETNKIGFEAEGEIDRQEWGLSWSETNEAGELLVADAVQLVLSVEADQQVVDAAAPDAETDA